MQRLSFKQSTISTNKMLLASAEHETLKNIMNLSLA